MTRETVPGRRLNGGLTTLGAAALAVGFLVLVGRYYAFYHLGDGGAVMGLLLVVLPATALVACAVALLARRRVLESGASLLRASLSGVAAAVLLLALLFALEVWRTTAMRSGEGIGAGDLAPFVRSLVSR